MEEYNDIEEEMYWTLEEYKKIDVQSRDIEFYVDLVERLSFLFIDLFLKNKECYEKLNIVLKQAKNDLKEISTITYSLSKVDNIYLPDAWYITPNGYLYNPGKDGHAGSDLTFTYQELKHSIINNKGFSNNKNKTSIEFKKMADDILMKEYISAGQFKFFINYISQPAYLDAVNGIPITREKHIINIVVGIIMAHAYFYEFFDNFFNYVKNPQIELDKIVELTNDEISDILVRCCGFHKVESMVENTITTSCINYEEEFRHYIEKGWTIQFIPPIIINKEKECDYENVMDVITKFVTELVEKQDLKYSDIKYLSSGSYSNAFLIGDKVIKIGRKRETYIIPNDKRILKPLIRLNLGDYSNIEGSIEVCNYVNTDINLSDEEMYQLYKELRGRNLLMKVKDFL